MDSYEAAPDPLDLRSLELAALNHHIEKGRATILTTPREHESLRIFLHRLAVQLSRRFQLTGSVKDLEDAIGFLNTCLQIGPSDHVERAKWLNNRNLQSQYRYQITHSLDDLNEAILHAQAALSNSYAILEDEERASWCFSLGVLFKDRFSHTGASEDLNGSICQIQKALDIKETISIRDKQPPFDLIYDPKQLLWTSKLGDFLYERFTIHGSSDDLSKSISVGKISCDSTPSHLPEHATRADRVAERYGNRFEKEGDTKALDKAIRLMRVAQKLESDDEQVGERLCRLATYLCYRFRHRNLVQDLDEGIQLLEKALVLSNISDLHKAKWLNNLSVLLTERFRRSGKGPDLDRAINAGKGCIDLTPIDDTELARRLNNRGDQLKDRYMILGAIEDLEESIQLGQQAVDRTSADNPEIAVWRNNLGQRLHARFHHVGDLNDLNESIRLAGMALGAKTRKIAGLPGRSEQLNNLSSRLASRYDRLGIQEDLQRAISLQQEAIDTTLPGHPTRAAWLFNLSTDFYSLYLLDSQFQHLQHAIKLSREALDAAAVGLVNRALWQDRLAILLEEEYEHLEKDPKQDGNIIILHEAIQLERDALDFTQSNDPFRTVLFNHLGRLLRLQFSKSKSMDHLNASTTAFITGLENATARPLNRVRAGRSAAYNLVRTKNWIRAADILQMTSDLLPRAFIIQKLPSFAPFVASVYINAGRPIIEALQVLERTRGIIAGFVFDSTSDVSELQREYPELCAQYVRLREAVAASFSDTRSTSEGLLSPETYATKLARRQQQLDELTKVEVQIRQQPNFQRFQLPLTETEFIGLAEHGPLVSFNVSYLGSHAFLISKGGVQLVPLPKLQQKDISNWIKLFASKGNPCRREANVIAEDDEETDVLNDRHNEISEGMQSLWNHAVKPILEVLGLLKPESSTLPYLWWVGGGLMALVPLHAAGNHSEGSTSNTLSHVISSFATTFKSLQVARKREWVPLKSNAHRLVMVAMPTTPGAGHKNLDVADEISAMKQFITPHQPVILVQPKATDVIKELKRCTIVHFACHGRVDRVQPTRSSLLLGNNALEELTIASLENVNQQQAQIAYLSACSTAEIAVHTLVDESIHLASSFQLIGFRHVIGTLWGAWDKTAGKVAQTFYQYLLQEDEMTDLIIARALHEAITYARSQPGESCDILKWAPFIHVGP
ncbi:hypothetical protein N431DRAFT_489968 [Stipitochalara longipes BDJ]|nr:hypothetical protein N431DRAFT_489968 [Stipitochalara longipes BDJ]